MSESKWRSTPAALRRRRGVQVMLPPDVREALERVASPGMRSALVEEALREHPPIASILGRAPDKTKRCSACGSVPGKVTYKGVMPCGHSWADLVWK